MITASVNNWTSVVGTDVPFTTVLKTNNKVTNKNGTFSIWKSGLYDIDANLVVSGVAGDIIANLYADGEETGVYAEGTTSETTTIITLPLTHAVRVVQALYPNVATISVQLDTAGLNVDGNIRIQSLV